MKRRSLPLVLLSLVSSSLLCAQRTPPLPEEPVPVTQAPANKGTPEQSLLTPPEGENQQVYGSRGALISAEAAQDLGQEFRAAYGQPASPRIVIHVNRALVDTNSGLRLTGKKEKFLIKVRLRHIRHLLSGSPAKDCWLKISFFLQATRKSNAQQQNRFLSRRFVPLASLSSVPAALSPPQLW